jgi:hypothetical protein
LAPWALLVGLLGAAPAWAGGYMQSGGFGYASIGVNADLDGGNWEKDGSHVSSSCGAEQSVSAYGEYGLSYYRTVFASTSITHRGCPGETPWGLGDTRVGLRGRVDPLSNAKVWEAALILPTSRVGGGTVSDTDSLGASLWLHYNPRPNPYDLNLERDPYSPGWGSGIGVVAWQRHLPHELHGYVGYTFVFSSLVPESGRAPLRLTTDLEMQGSFARTHETRLRAVDAHDDYYLATLNFKLSYPLARRESLLFSLGVDLAGQNHKDSTGIGVSYGFAF